MKKLVAVLLLAAASTSAMAQHYGHGIRHNHHRHHGHYGHHNWMTPLIIGGVVGYALTRPAPVVVEQPPVYVHPQYPTVVQPQCTRYIFQDQFGQTIREEVRCN
jgi:hypothetical protein